MNHRGLILGFALLTGCVGALSGVVLAAPPPQNLLASEALQRLSEGNQRFVTNHSQHPHQSHEWLEQIRDGQHPFAAVVTCSDSRVAPEILFDQGLGDIFDVRVAGNIADDAVLGSLEYAVEHLHAPLILVLGHQHCGAVQAAMAHMHPHNHLNHIIRSLAPAVRHAHGSVEAASRENVRRMCHRLGQMATLKAKMDAGELRVVGGYYRLDTGDVEFLDTFEGSH